MINENFKISNFTEVDDEIYLPFIRNVFLIGFYSREGETSELSHSLVL